MTENVLFHFVNISEYMRNKEEIVYSLKRYLKTCEEVEDTWSQTPKSEVLKTMSGLLKKVVQINLPEVQRLGWSHAYFFESDGMYLRLLQNTDFEIDEDAKSCDWCIKENFALVKESYEYLSVKDYAELYEVNEVTVRQWIRRGKLRSTVKRGGVVYSVC